MNLDKLIKEALDEDIYSCSKCGWEGTYGELLDAEGTFGNKKVCPKCQSDAIYKQTTVGPTSEGKVKKSWLAPAKNYKCEFCGWQGDVGQTIVNDNGEVECPECGMDLGDNVSSKKVEPKEF